MTAPKALVVIDNLKDKKKNEKRIREIFEGPVQFTAIPKHEGFAEIAWYWDEDERRHFTDLMGTEVWYARQERIDFAIKSGVFALEDTPGNPPIQSNMERQLERMRLFNLNSVDKASVFFNKANSDYAQFVILWQLIQEQKEKSDRNKVLDGEYINGVYIPKRNNKEQSKHYYQRRDRKEVY